MTGLSSVPPFSLPGPGAVALAYGNSISDLSAGLGDWFTALCHRYGWIRANSNMIPNGNFENDATYQVYQMQWTTPVGTLSLDTTQGKFGSSSGKLAPNSPTAPYTSPFNAIIHDPAGDVSAGIPTNAMKPGITYVFSVWVYLPTGTTAAPYLQFLDRLTTDPAGVYGISVSAPASLTTLNTWQQLSVTRTVRGPIPAEAFVRVVYPETSGNASKAIWIDGAMLEAASGPTYQTNPQPSSTTQFFDNATRAAISGSELQNLILQTDRGNSLSTYIYNNGIIEQSASNIAGFQARVAAIAPDIVFVMYSTNDLYRWQSVANPATPTTSLITWRNAVTSLSTVTSPNPSPQLTGSSHGLLYQLLTLPKVPLIVWCGELMTTWTWADTSLAVTIPNDPTKWPGPTTDGGYRDQLAADMDEVARQECAKVNVPFVAIRPFMHPALCLPPPPPPPNSPYVYQGNKHPSPSGMQFLTAHIARALEQGH